MPGPEKNLRQAARIADLRQKIVDAQAKLETARKEHEQASKTLATAPDSGKPAAEKAVAQKDEQLLGAQEELEVLQSQLTMLLPGSDGARSVGSLLIANGMVIGFFVLALLVIVVLMIGIFVGPLLTTLSGTAPARGLITFLIAVITVSIALILVLSTVVSESSDREKRFLQGKEVLTMLIGVLGTIVGFYFGHSLDEAANPLRIGPTAIKKFGDTLQLVTYVSGGKAPYGYGISFTPKEIPEVKNDKAPDGLIIAEVAAPNVADNTEITFEIVVKDSQGNTKTHKGKERLSAKVEGGEKKGGK
jgi:hypothetical protein